MKIIEIILGWIDPLRKARRLQEEEEQLFRKNLENLWQRPKGEDGEQTNERTS